MEKLTPAEQKIADFIYDKPDVVVLLLQKYGYDISMSTATIPQINALVFKALTVDNNVDFGKDFDKSVASDGELNFIVTAVLSVATSVISGIMGQDTASKNREAQKQIALANFASQEKIAMEQLRAQSETDRTKILANTLLEYRKTLQLESTARLKDTWIYVVGLGIGLSIIYGIYFLASKD